MRFFAIIILLLLATPALAQSIDARPPCTDRQNALASLAQKYKEAPIAMGVTHKGGLIEVLATSDGTTWTIIVTTPQGVSCMVAAGEGWRGIEPILLDPET